MGLLTKEAKIEPPIHELNLRSTVVLFAINFRRMLCIDNGVKQKKKIRYNLQEAGAV